jgi:hypothetical protein
MRRLTSLRGNLDRRTCLVVLLVSALSASAIFLETCRPQPPRPPATSEKRVVQPADTSDAGFLDEHANTGFPLLGRHREIACDACHGETPPKPSCASCHRSPHGDGLKKTCADCHTPGLPFANVKFKHPAKDLFAFHQDVPCMKCHEGKNFEKANRNCTSCHEDFHKGSLGTDCYECHRSPVWSVTRFNHNMTGFPLMGAHRALECGDCHRDLQSFRIVPRPTQCASCHEADYRSSRFPHAAYGAGTNCQECHQQDTWAYAHSPFWFNVQTGTHAGVACGTCHGNAQNYKEYSCHACHAGHANDNGGRCLDCHPGGFPGGGGD